MSLGRPILFRRPGVATMEADIRQPPRDQPVVKRRANPQSKIIPILNQIDLSPAEIKVEGYCREPGAIGSEDSDKARLSQPDRHADLQGPARFQC